MSKIIDIEELIIKASKLKEEGKYSDALIYYNLANKDIEKLMDIYKDIAKKLISSQESRLSEMALLIQRITSLKHTVDRDILLCSSLQERAKKFVKLVEYFHENEIMSDIMRQKLKLDEIISRPRTILIDDKFFICLRKWNSYTPFISTRGNDSSGGYFLVWEGKGIVIDPGINFIEQFLLSNFSILDIDTIILTHSHVDHTSDFEGILTIIHEINDIRINSGMLQKLHKIDILLNIGAANKFINLLTLSNRNINKIIIAKQKEQYKISSLILTLCYAKHPDLYGTNEGCCLGLLFSYKNIMHIGITGDTGYDQNLKSDYSVTNNLLMVLHIGSIKKDELNLGNPLETVYDVHLGLKGVFNILSDVNPKLAILSEFGEELKNMRINIADSLSTLYPGIKIIPGDIMLKIILNSDGEQYKFECSSCKNNYDVDELHYVLGENDNIRYMCDLCCARAHK